MRPDGVEIKVSLSDRQVAKALEALELDGNGEPRRVGFIEDTTVGVALPLFHQGVVLRIRQIEDGDDDATVKLRPCRRSQLTEGWLGAEKGDRWRLRVKKDTVEEARAAQAGLEQAMGVLGFERDDQHASKTERVLAHLVGLEP